MPNPFIFLVATTILKCATPLVLPADHVMTEQDWGVYSTAYNRCKQLYGESPCLKRFIIRAPGVYNAVCGPEIEEKP